MYSLQGNKEIAESMYYFFLVFYESEHLVGSLVIAEEKADIVLQDIL